MISKIILGLFLLEAAISQNKQYNVDLESIIKLHSGTPAASGPSLLPGSTAAVNIVNSVVILLPPATDAGMIQNRQYNNELSSIAKLLQVLRGPPVGFPSPATPTENETPASGNMSLATEGAACRTDDVAGVCTELRKCDSASQEIQNGKTLQFCRFAGSEPVVCCVLSTTTSNGTTTTTLTTTTTSTTTSTTTTATPEPVPTTTESNDSVTTDNEVAEITTTEPEREGCGWSYARVGESSASDEGVQDRQFPWICAVFRIEAVTEGTVGAARTREVYERTGALIHPAVVLIEGFYLDDDKRHRVRAGAGVGSGASTAGGRRDQLRDVENFAKSDWPYGLTLAFLSAPMTLTSNVALACLPPAGPRVQTGATCLVQRWDQAQGDVYNYEDKLLKMQVTTIWRGRCESELVRRGDLIEGRSGLHDVYSCVKRHGSGLTINETMCKEMSRQSSLLSCPVESNGDRYVLSGLMGFANCYKDPIWTFAELSRYRTIIDEAMTARGYNTTTYSVDSR